MNDFDSCILGVDPGEKNIGLAKSDPLGISAAPLRVIQHVNREQDAQTIAAIAKEIGASRIVIGQALDPDGNIGPAALLSQKLADAIQPYFDGELILWDESGSTKKAKRIFIEMNVPKKRRRGHLDANAAAVILQDYLDHAFYRPITLFMDDDDSATENG